MNFCNGFYKFSLKSYIYVCFAELRFSLKIQNPKYLNYYLLPMAGNVNLYNYTPCRVQSSTFKQILNC